MRKVIVIILGIFLLRLTLVSSYSAEDISNEFKDKVAIITGSSSGLGKAMAELAAKKQMKLILADINLKPSKKLAGEIRENGGQAIAIQIDLARPEKRKRIIDLAMKEYGRIDYLINNAAYIYAAEVKNFNLEEAHNLFEANFWAYLDLAIRVIPIMEKQGSGTIINISSVEGLSKEVLYGVGAYTASKYAIIGIFKTLALELKDKNINVKIACPAFIRTQICNNAVGPLKEKIKMGFDRQLDTFDSPEIIAEDIFNKLHQKEIIILSGKAQDYL